MGDLAATIAAGMAELGWTDTSAAGRLARFLDRLARWNRVYNLTAVRDPAAMVSRHILDSLAIAPWLCGPRVLDVGSGAGLPGIPLAITHPALHFDLVDSNGKRTRFMIQMQAELALDNITVCHTRIEDYHPEQAAGCVVARAFAPAERLLALTARLCAPEGRILIMQGTAGTPPVLPGGWHRSGPHRLRIPGLDAERSLLVLTRTGSLDFP
jgi:16S rRNA (guanine527-N7)-methyltransferase